MNRTQIAGTENAARSDDANEVGKVAIGHLSADRPGYVEGAGLGRDR